MIRAFSTAAKVSFRKESVTQFNNIIKNSSPIAKAAAPKKWTPTNGNSFRSFAEYRLKVTNQLPLNIRFKGRKN